APEVVTNAAAEVRLEGIRSRRKVERQGVARDVRISGLIEHDVRARVGAGRGAAAGTTAAEIRRVDEPGGVRVQLDDKRVGETTIDMLERVEDREESRVRDAHDVRVAAAVDRDRVARVVDLAIEIRRVDERGPAGRDLRDEGVGAPLDAVPLSRVLLDDTGRGREVHGLRLARHVHVAVGVERDAVDHGASRATEVRRIEKLRAVGAQLRNESAEADDTATARQLDRVDEWEVAGRRGSRAVRVSGRVDRDAGGRVVALAAEERRVEELAT